MIEGIQASRKAQGKGKTERAKNEITITNFTTTGSISSVLPLWRVLLGVQTYLLLALREEAVAAMAVGRVELLSSERVDQGKGKGNSKMENGRDV